MGIEIVACSSLAIAGACIGVLGTCLLIGIFAYLVSLSRKTDRLVRQTAQHHRIIATVAPMIGLVNLLKEADEDDSLTKELRERAYVAFDDAANKFNASLRGTQTAEESA